MEIPVKLTRVQEAVKQKLHEVKDKEKAGINTKIDPLVKMRQILARMQGLELDRRAIQRLHRYEIDTEKAEMEIIRKQGGLNIDLLVYSKLFEELL